MTEPTFSHLRLFNEPRPGEPPTLDSEFDLEELCRAFEASTGWPLRYVPFALSDAETEACWCAPLDDGSGGTGQLRMENASQHRGNGPVADLHDVADLASSVADLLAGLSRARHALWQREAELATGVPLVPHPDEEEHLAQRLEAILRAAAEGLDASAAGLYLLDQATTELKLRARWPLSHERLTDPARPLGACAADVEAMAGHAVALEDGDSMSKAQAPEDFAAGLCIPVASATQIFGTLWVYDGQPRPFDDKQANLVEIIAGRIACELERAVLLSDGQRSAEVQRNLLEAERVQRDELPTVLPPMKGWDLSGWSEQSQGVGGSFFDWLCLPGGAIAVVLVQAEGAGLPAALVATGLRGLIRAHAETHPEPAELLGHVNRTLWTSSPGDKLATALYAVLEPASGTVRYAVAGNPAALHLAGSEFHVLSGPQAPLGLDPDVTYPEAQVTLARGDALALFSSTVRDAAGHEGQPLGVHGAAEVLLPHVAREPGQGTAAEMATALRQRVQAHTPPQHDRTLLVARRMV